MTINPYAAPSASVADPQASESVPAIWNPNAAANWSLIFSPAFGAFIHMRNWHALGEFGREATSKRWFVAGLFMLVIYVVLALVLADSKSADAITRALGFAFLLTWYFSAARGQAKYVKNKFGKSYPRKKWGKPLLIGVVVLVGYVLAVGAIGFIFAALRKA